MADDNDRRTIRLSRRTVLGSMGALGAASALGGAGTMAFFSDQENFTNNELVAGALDMKVSWEEHYSDWSPDEMALMEDGYVTDIDAFQEATLLEQFPEGGLQEGQDPCEVLADVPDDLQAPVIDITDVKPGDSGEVTFDFALCDNPGYVWMNGNLIENAENGLTEPEGKDPDENGGKPGELADEIRTAIWYDENCNNLRDVDLVLTIDVSGSMLYRRFGGVVAESGGPGGGVLTKIDLLEQAAKELVSDLFEDGPCGVDARVGVVFFANSDNITVGSALTRDLDSLVGSGGVLDDLRQEVANATGGTTDPEDGDGIATGTDIAGGIDRAQTDVLTDDDRQKANIALTNGSSFTQGGGEVADSVPQGAADDARADLPGNPPTDLFTVGISSTKDTLLQQMAGPAGSGGGDPAYFANVDDATDLPAAVQGFLPLLGEEVIFQGTLAETIALLSQGNGVPLDGDRSTQYREVLTDGGVRPAPGDDPDRECYEPGTAHCIGFQWCLPVDHANEIQTDSVKFDLGFYTEQCRHNDGAGMASAASKRGSGFAKLRQVENRDAGYGTGGENFQQPIAGAARARNGDNGNPGLGASARTEVLVGTGDVGQAANIDQEVSHDWGGAGDSSAAYTEETSFEYSYDAGTGTATFDVDGETVTSGAFTPRGRLALQAKADDATVSVENVRLDVDGSPVGLDATSFAATDDGAGRDIQYLAMNTDLDGSQSFAVSGDLTVETQDDFGGGNEDWALDVVVE